MLTRRSITLAATGSVLLAGFQTVQAQNANNTLILGQSAVFSGPAAQLGIQFHAGAKIAFDQVNALGGINQQKIEIRQMDDGYEPTRTAENTRKLLAEGVFALFGYIGTPTSLAALPMATAEKIPFIAPFTGAMVLRDPANPFVFHLRASYNDETALIVQQLLSLNLNEIGVFYQNDAYGKAGLEGIKLALAAKNLKTAAEATVERNSLEVLPAVKKLLAASSNAIVQIGTYQACAAFVREARKAGYKGNFYNVSFVGTEAFAKELGKDGFGVQVSQVVPSPYKSLHPVVRDFTEAVKAAGKDANANYSSLEGYLAAKLFLEGLKRAGPKATRESFLTGMQSIGSQSIGGFVIALTPTSRVASKFVELSMLTGDGRILT